jgi:hypothetical protein
MECNNNLESESTESLQSTEIKLIPQDDIDRTIKLSLVEIEEFLRSNKIPPGIKQYDDIPSLENQLPSSSTIEKLKKPWETEENIKKLNFLQGDQSI